MTDKELRKLKRVELLEILVSLSEENEQLRKENEELREALSQKEICIEQSGSIAEASLKLSGVFEAAQRAADLYLENVRRLAGEKGR